MKRGILFTFLTQAPTLLFYFVSSTLMTRILGDVGRGEYALLISQVLLLTMLVSLNMNYGITYYTAKTTADLRRSVGTAASFLLITVLLLPLLLWALASSDRITDLLMPTHRTSIFYWAFVYVSIIMGVVNSSISAVLLGLKKFKAINGISILNALASALVFLLLYLYHGKAPLQDGLAMVLWATLAVNLVPLIGWCILYKIHVNIRPVPEWSWAYIRPMLSFSLVGYATNLVNMVNYRFDVWVVDQYQGASALGLYAVAVGIGQLLFYIPDPFARVVQPFLFGQEKDEMMPRYKAVARVNFTAILVLGLALGLLASWIIPMLYGDVFRSSAPALRILLPGILFSGATKLMVQLVVQRGHQRFNLLATGVAAAFTILLDLLLIPRWGIEGAALASTISYLIILSIVVWVIRFRIGIPVRDMFLLRRSDLALLKNGPVGK